MEIQMQNKLSSAQLRKIKKPIIERRRRERINDSMNQLKTLLLEALNKDVPSHSKMEKADILELAVDYLKTVKTATGKPSRKEAVAKYQSGYKQCAQEVSQYLGGVPGVHPEVISRVRGHLEQRDRQSQHVEEMKTRATETTSFTSLPGAPKGSRLPQQQIPAPPVPVYANGHMQYAPQQVIVSPTGVQSLPVQIQQINNGLFIKDVRQSDSIPRNASPLSASEAFMGCGGPQKCGLEVSTGIPGLCLVKSHSDMPIWRPW